VRAAGWTEEEVKPRPKGDFKKARLAAWLRQETVMLRFWIAKRFEMGDWRTMADAMQARRRN